MKHLTPQVTWGVGISRLSSYGIISFSLMEPRGFDSFLLGPSGGACAEVFALR